MAPQWRSKVDRGTVLGFIAVIISIVGVVGPVGAGGAVSGKIVKVTSEKPAECPQGQTCPWIPNGTITGSDVAGNTIGPPAISKVGTKEMLVPSIQRSSSSAQAVANGDSTFAQEALEFHNVGVVTGGSSAPRNCPPLKAGFIVASSCVIVARDGIYDVEVQALWEGNATGRRSIWGVRYHPSGVLDDNYYFVETEPATAAHPAYGGQVVNLSFSMELEAGLGVMILGSQDSGGELDVLGKSTLTVTWSAPLPPE